jgi:type IV fimbrial biogenesis protein FimT
MAASGGYGGRPGGHAHLGPALFDKTPQAAPLIPATKPLVGSPNFGSGACLQCQPMKKAKYITANRQRGFTLIELMIAVAILAILLSLAVPSFQDTIRRNQITANTNSLVTSLALARSEATKRGIRVSLCASNGVVCTGSTDWSTGWQVIEDRDGNGALDAPDVTLQVSPVPSTGMIMTGDNASVTFESTGENLTARTFSISKYGCGAQQKRQITVATSGRSQLAKADCP